MTEAEKLTSVQAIMSRAGLVAHYAARFNRVHAARVLASPDRYTPPAVEAARYVLETDA